jgi:molecular chaperone GrpE
MAQTPAASPGGPKVEPLARPATGPGPQTDTEAKGQEAIAAAEADEGLEPEPAVEAASPAGAGAETGADPTQLVALLEDARAKADTHWDQLLRARAEIENLHRRQARELENAHKFALEGFLRELLMVRDSLELGYDAAHAEGANLDKLREGTELTLKLMVDTMAKFGVEVIAPEGQPFNPELHQAMTTMPRDDLPPNTVVTVVQKGYLLNGRLVRPAMVIVSRKP